MRLLIREHEELWFRETQRANLSGGIIKTHNESQACIEVCAINLIVRRVSIENSRNRSLDKIFKSCQEPSQEWMQSNSILRAVA